jgi:hypothetical protein
VSAAEIVVSDVQCDRCDVVIQLLAKAVRKRVKRRLPIRSERLLRLGEL